MVFFSVTNTEAAAFPKIKGNWRTEPLQDVDTNVFSSIKSLYSQCQFSTNETQRIYIELASEFNSVLKMILPKNGPTWKKHLSQHLKDTFVDQNELLNTL